MTPHWLLLLPALVLLFVPIRVFHGPKVRHRPIMRDWAEHWTAILALGLHWIDLGRAVLGAWWLVEAVPLDPGAVGFMRFGVPLLRGLTAILAVAVQTLVCREKQCFNAPFMFVSGVLLGLPPPAVAGLAILLAATITAGSATPPAYFPLLGVSLVGIGYFLEGRAALVPLAFGFSAALVPWLLPMMFHRTPVVTYRARRMLRPSPEPSASGPAAPSARP